MERRKLLSKYLKAAFSIFIYATTVSSVCSHEIELLPERTPTHPYSLEDIDCHAPQSTINYYRNQNDLVNWGHECLHSVHARIRQLNPGYNGFYVLNNKAFIFKEPKIRISSVAREIPRNLQEEIYTTYLVQSQKDWEFEPLYLFDEFSAYVAGSLVAKDYKLKDRLDTSNENGLKMAAFCLYMLKETKAANYEEFEGLRQFWLFQVRRLYSLSSANQKQKFLNDLTNSAAMLEWIKSHFSKHEISELYNVSNTNK